MPRKKAEPAKESDSHLKTLIERRMYELGRRKVAPLERDAGVAPDTIRNILRGKTKTIHADKIEGLARALRISVAELVSAQGFASGASREPPPDALKVYSGMALRPNGEPSARVAAMISITGPIGDVRPNPDTDYFMTLDDDSMAPTVKRGDLVMVRRGHVEPKPRKIYLLRAPGGGIVRRLTPRLAAKTFDITADNPEFEPESLPARSRYWEPSCWL